MMMTELTEQMADANRASYSQFVDAWATEGWCDPGELGALLAVADRARDKAILDIGVGGGRTTSLLRLLSADYVGIDYNSDLVELTRTRQPGIDVRAGDARRLTEFADASRDLVLFSYNGIDTVGHDDRQAVLAEVHRVLRPGGIFVFSTLNKDNPTFGARPGEAPARQFQPGTLLPVPADSDQGETGPADDSSDETEPRWVRAVRNWRRLRKEMVDAGDWGIAANPGQEFSLLNHFITVDGERRELAAHGFSTELVFCCDSRIPIESDAAVTSIYMYFVASR